MPGFAGLSGIVIGNSGVIFTEEKNVLISNKRVIGFEEINWTKLFWNETKDPLPWLRV